MLVGGKLDEGNQKAQTSSYKINSTRDVMYNMINIINTAIWHIYVWIYIHARWYMDDISVCGAAELFNVFWLVDI